MTPDIHSDNPVVDLPYMIAVMQAAADGKTVEFYDKQTPVLGWMEFDKPTWNWPNYIYRIAPSEIAAGHNPGKLTEDQVGVKDGWRLLTREEIENRNRFDKPLSKDDIQILSDGWLKGGCGASLNQTYRTKQPPGYFAPKPKKKVPLAPEDLGPIVWVRDRQISSRYYLVVAVAQSLLIIFSDRGKEILDLLYMVEKWEYSADLKNWKPCYKEIDQ